MQCLCDNPDCKWHKEQRGGRFTFVEGHWYCEECAPLMRMPDNHGESPFSFTTMHIGDDPNRGPIKVQGLQHLRRLEREHKVQSVAANMDSKNWER